MNASRAAKFKTKSLIIIFLSISGLCFAQASPEELLKQVAANWKKNRIDSPTFTYEVLHKVFDKNPWGANAPPKVTKYDVLVIEGLPYMRAMEVNGKPLSPADAAEEQSKYEKAVEDRRHLTPEQRAVAYDVNLKMPIEWLPELFNVKFSSKKDKDPNIVVLDCEPRALRPGNDDEREVLAHSYRLWIDKNDMMPTKMESKVINDNAFMKGGRVERNSTSTYKWVKIGHSWVIASSESSYRIWFSHDSSAQGSIEETYSKYKEFHATATVIPK